MIMMTAWRKYSTIMGKCKEGVFLNEVTWKIKVPIFKSRIILKQLGIAIGIPFGILIIILLVLKAYYGVLLIALTLFLTAIFVLLVFKGTYDVHFLINKKGIQYKNQPQHAKRVKKVSAITTILGLFACNPTAAGAGLLSGTRTDIFIPWKRIKKVKYLQKQNCIMLYCGFAENIAVFCTAENFNEVKLSIKEATRGEQ